MKITIREFMALQSLDLQLTAPLNIIVGQNEMGKSSIRDAILWVFTGQARGLKTHQEQASLIHEGGKAAEVAIKLANGAAFSRRKTPKSAATVQGEIPDIGLSPAILFDPYIFLALPEAQGRELLFQVIPGLNPTIADICSRLRQDEFFKVLESDETNPNGASMLTIVKIAVSQGFPAAEKEAVARRREAKQVRDNLGETKEPEQTITIDGQEYSIPTLNFQAIEGTLKELMGQKDDLLRQKGAGEARTRRRDQIKLQLERIAALAVPDVNDLMILEKELEDYNAKVTEATQEIAKAGTQQQFYPATCPVITIAQTPCPNAGRGVGQEPPPPGVLEALQQNKSGFAQKAAQTLQRLQEIKRQNQEYSAAMARKTELEKELENLETEPEAGLDLDAEIATRERRIDRGRAFQKAIQDYDADLARAREAQVKMKACDQEVTLYDALAKALAPSGIPSQMIAEALDGINKKLAEISKYLFPNRELRLTPELNIALQNSPYATLSKSEKFRVGVAFQYALAGLAGARLLMIDEADILDSLHWQGLINFLLTRLSDFDQILVFCTSDSPRGCADPRADSWWLENGQISKVMGVGHG